MSHVWSYSSLDKFAQCPRAFYHRYVLKEKEPETEALRYGQQVHAALEERIKGRPLPECYLKFDPMAYSIISAWRKGMKVYTELKMGLTKDLEPCGFFDKMVWGRGSADVVLIHNNGAVIFDWKTGKRREKEDQIRILAMFIFKHFPELTHVSGCNLWLEANDIGTPFGWNRSDEPGMWKQLLPKIQAMEKAFASSAWPEMPSGLCGWCSVKVCSFNRS